MLALFYRTLLCFPGFSWHWLLQVKIIVDGKLYQVLLGLFVCTQPFVREGTPLCNTTAQE